MLVAFGCNRGPFGLWLGLELPALLRGGLVVDIVF